MIRTKDDGGTLPKVTGNLARSLLAQIGSMPAQAQGAASFLAGEEVGLVAARAVLGDQVFLGYQAVYARRQNFGFVGADSLGRVYNQAGNGFVERALAMWPQLVDQAVRDVRGA